MCPGIGILTFYGQRGRKANGPFLVPFVPMILQASWSTSRSYSSVIPKRSRGCYGILAFEYAFVFGEFFINDGLFIFMFFSWWRGCVRVHYAFAVECHFLENVIKDTLNHAIASGPPGGRGEIAMSPPRRACHFFLHGGFVHVAQSVPQVHAVPSACSKCSGRSVSFNAQPLWERRDNTCRSFGSASTHVTGVHTGGIMGMLGPWCGLTSGYLPQGRPTPKLAGD